MGAVIPCKDEVATIERCLRALRAQQPRIQRIVVVDNGSTDGSLQIAQALADEVVQVPPGSGSISLVRNTGARALPDVDVIAFVDADTEVAPDWLAVGLEALRSADMVGSRSGSGDDAGWVARRWAAVEAFTADASSLLWSQHLLVRRDAFEAVGGFGEDVIIGEDGDLTRKVRATGRSVVLEQRLHAAHHGFPDDLGSFLRRERWHTSHPGWFGRMSPKSRTVVLAGAGWAVLGAAAGAVAVARRRPAALALWLAGTAAGGSAVGSRTASRPADVPQDALLVGLWAGVRVLQLPRELLRRG